MLITYAFTLQLVQSSDRELIEYEYIWYPFFVYEYMIPVDALIFSIPEKGMHALSAACVDRKYAVVHFLHQSL